jgi:hypothetical protein
MGLQFARRMEVTTASYLRTTSRERKGRGMELAEQSLDSM